MREFDLIKKYFHPLTNNVLAAQNLADDTARITLNKDEELIVSTDTIVENVHFFAEENAKNIAIKLLASNLSDLASAGATPLYYLLNYSKKSGKNEEEFTHSFVAGLKKMQKKFGLSLIGGDTVNSKNRFFSITIFGKTKKGQALLRQDARAGDLIFVSGNIGDAYLGLQEKKSGKKDSYLIRKFLFPEPRIALGQELLQQKISRCATDISDGLLADIRQICLASKLTAEINFSQIPFSTAARKYLKEHQGINKIDLLSGGDDYELIFTAAAKERTKIAKLAKKIGVKLSCIGQMQKTSEKPQISLLDKEQKIIKLSKFGYEHQ